MIKLLTLLMVLLMFRSPTSQKPPENRNTRSAVQIRQPVIKDLLAAGPAPALKDKLMLFGQFVGDWKAQDKEFDLKGRLMYQGSGQIHFGWILYGTAIQDVWEGASDHPKNFGTTVRSTIPQPTLGRA